MTKNLIAIKSESRGANSLPSMLLNSSGSTLDARELMNDQGCRSGV